MRVYLCLSFLQPSPQHTHRRKLRIQCEQRRDDLLTTRQLLEERDREVEGLRKSLEASSRVSSAEQFVNHTRFHHLQGEVTAAMCWSKMRKCFSLGSNVFLLFDGRESIQGENARLRSQIETLQAALENARRSVTLSSLWSPGLLRRMIGDLCPLSCGFPCAMTCSDLEVP